MLILILKNVWDTILIERENGEYIKRKASSKSKNDKKINTN